jgi:WD40 repeat protein
VIRQATTGKPVQVFTGFGKISSIDFDSNNSRLVTGDLDGNIVIWKLSDLTRLASIDVFDGILHRGQLYDNRVRFQPNGEQLAVATSGTGGEVTFWNSQSGKFIARLPDCDRVRSAEFSRDGKSLFLGDYQKICVVDVRTRMLERQLTSTAVAKILEFSTDGKRLISSDIGPSDWDLYVWNLENDKNRRIKGLLDQREAYLRGIAMHPTRDDVAVIDRGPGGIAGGAGGRIQVWNSTSGEELLSRQSPDPRRLCQPQWTIPCVRCTQWQDPHWKHARDRFSSHDRN